MHGSPQKHNSKIATGFIKRGGGTNSVNANVSGLSPCGVQPNFLCWFLQWQFPPHLAGSFCA